MRSNSPTNVSRRPPIGSQDKEPERVTGRRLGKLYIVSLGPGDPNYLAPRARGVLMDARVIVGYRTYMNLIEPVILEGKETIDVEKCRREMVRGKVESDYRQLC